MKKNKFLARLLYFIFSLFTMVFAHATSAPLFTFLPLTPTTIKVTNDNTETVQYVLTNMSSKTHTLMMVPIEGITQITSAGYCLSPFILASKQSCILNLQVNGSEIPSYITGGPRVCQQGTNGNPSPLQCYQPSIADLLNVIMTPSILYVGTQNGNVYYSENNGASWTPTNVPAGGSAINAVFATDTTLYAGAANGTIYSSFNNGQTWFPIAVPSASSAVNGLYVLANTLYVASANGNVFLCALNGSHCETTTSPDGSAVNGVFATTNALYASTTNGNVYYSNNNGFSWTPINGQPDQSAVEAIYIAGNTLYASTADEYVYTTTSLTGGGSWNLYAQTVYSFFASPDGSQIFAGNQSGYVFSLTEGTQLGFVANTSINSVFLFN